MTMTQMKRRWILIQHKRYRVIGVRDGVAVIQDCSVERHDAAASVRFVPFFGLILQEYC